MTALSWRTEWRKLAWLTAGFLLLFFLPVGSPRFDGAVLEALALSKWYAREHVLLCLVPAFFIAGAIATFVSQAGVMRYLGPNAKPALAYGVASVSGTILAVCSCTVLPLFAGIYRMGAGLGPATAFLYSGPAINVLAIVLTARVLGLELGVVRAVGAILFSVIIGLSMHALHRGEERERAAVMAAAPAAEAPRPLGQTAAFLGFLVAILVFANWGEAGDAGGSLAWIHAWKWRLTGASALGLAYVLLRHYELGWPRLLLVALPTVVLAALFPGHPLVPFTAASVLLGYVTSRDSGELGDWFEQTWGFAKQILPLLFAGVLVAGFLLGRPGHEGWIPSRWVQELVGGNSLGANLFSAVAGAFMYFATLTEVPILQGLIDNGMGKGPALALLLAGPALSLPNMLVIRSVMGTRKTIVFVSLVVVMATISGLLYGALAG